MHSHISKYNRNLLIHPTQMKYTLPYIFLICLNIYFKVQSTPQTVGQCHSDNSTEPLQVKYTETKNKKGSLCKRRQGVMSNTCLTENEARMSEVNKGLFIFSLKGVVPPVQAMPSDVRLLRNRDPATCATSRFLIRDLAVEV